jgi:uroporphyrinogen-III decarboxylase
MMGYMSYKKYQGGGGGELYSEFLVWIIQWMINRLVLACILIANHMLSIYAQLLYMFNGWFCLYIYACAYVLHKYYID